MEDSRHKLKLTSFSAPESDVARTLEVREPSLDACPCRIVFRSRDSATICRSCRGSNLYQALALELVMPYTGLDLARIYSR